MGGSEAARRGAGVTGAALCAALLAAACRTAAPEPAAAPAAPQTEVAPPAVAVPEPARRPPEAPPDPFTTLDPATERAKTLIVIDPAADTPADAAPDLVAAAQQERERRRAAERPIAVIDQKNLATWAAGGVLTQTAEREPPSAAEAAAAAAVEEQYWRRRGREIRQRWRDAHDRIAVLEGKAQELRNRFYSTDDPWVRDTQVKPEWDKAIADLEEARFVASRGASEVLAFLEEGREAGALPGWLREGNELEPEPVVETVDEAGAALEAKEPVIYRDPETEGEPGAPPPGGGAPRRP
jgi:hypothetical protein